MTVKLNLKEIFQKEKKFSQSYTLRPEDIKLPADLGEIREPLTVHVEITKEQGGYRVSMKIEGYVVLECARCLTVYHKDISRSESIRLEPYPAGGIVYLQPGELDVSFYENEEDFDLLQLVREQIILSIPTKPLCSPDCTPDFYRHEEERITLGDILSKAL